jgi:hypothetical protein
MKIWTGLEAKAMPEARGTPHLPSLGLTHLEKVRAVTVVKWVLWK